MSGNKVEAVFWDFGGVFTSSPFVAMVSYAEKIGVEPQLVSDALFGPMYDTPDHPWHQLERGEAALSVATDHAKAELAKHGVEFSLGEMFSTMSKMADGSRPLVRQRAEALRAAGMKQGIITNNLAEFRDMWRSTMPIDEIFDDVVDSHEVGLRKPDPAIYRLAADRLGVALERSVFLDDLAANVDAAAALGMQAILVDPDPAEALEKLADLTDM